jgi:hypothetical protein
MTKVDPVLIGIIRRVYPQVIANDILGVQNMTAPSGDIFKTRTRYVTGRLNNNHYQNFLRLNNRRKTQRRIDFEKAGYPSVVTTAAYYTDEWINWMKENIGQHQYFVFGNTVFFENEKLMVLYQLRWS